MDNNVLKALNVIEQVNNVILGKDKQIREIMAAFLAGGHILLEDIPGVGKTTLATAFSKAMALDCKRVQFTPDVMPSDLTGYSVYRNDLGQFIYQPGSVFCNLLLADEINRTSPKTQAALLEVMEEGKVTVDGTTHYLPDPFFVIATQNPMGYVGTQKLPESQLDRFMIKMSMGYPDEKSEIDIYNGRSYSALDEVRKVISSEDIVNIRKTVENVHIDEKLMEYLVRIVRLSRENQYVSLGISPRGGIALVKMSKSTAYMNGRDYVIPEDILECIDSVAEHRLVLNSKAKANGYTEQDIINDLKDRIAVP